MGYYGLLAAPLSAILSHMCPANYHPRRASPSLYPRVRTCAPTLWLVVRRHRCCCCGRRYTTILRWPSRGPNPDPNPNISPSLSRTANPDVSPTLRPDANRTPTPYP
jgi:hypothetical protein